MDLPIFIRCPDRGWKGEEPQYRPSIIDENKEKYEWHPATPYRYAGWVLKKQEDE